MTKLGSKTHILFYIDTVHHQNRQDRNTRIFEKYSNCDQEMAFRNGRLMEKGKGKRGTDVLLRMLKFRARMRILSV